MRVKRVKNKTFPSQELQIQPPKADYTNNKSGHAHKHLNWGLKTPENLTRGERKALLENKNIIKPSDKGNAMVIIDKTQYIWEGQRQLAVKEHYCTLEEPIFQETRIMVEEILDEMLD